MIYYPRAPKRAIDGRLYTDGGVLVAKTEQRDGSFDLTRGTSPIGLVWAWVRTDTDDTLLEHGSGFLLCPIEADRYVWPAKTDLAEFYAAYRGLQALPTAWHGEVLLDSHLTIRRMFEACAVNTVPRPWVTDAAAERRRAGKLWPVHVAGHPTLAELGDQRRADGSPVSKWNVYADMLCNDQKAVALECWYENHPETRPDDTHPTTTTAKQPSYPHIPRTSPTHPDYPRLTGDGVHGQSPAATAGVRGREAGG